MCIPLPKTFLATQFIWTKTDTPPHPSSITTCSSPLGCLTPVRCWHPTWAPTWVPAAPLPIPPLLMCLGKQWTTSAWETRKRLLASAVADPWGVNQQMEELCPLSPHRSNKKTFKKNKKLRCPDVLPGSAHQKPHVPWLKDPLPQLPPLRSGQPTHHTPLFHLTYGP